jgi:protein-disulfide isomerase
MMAAKAGGSGRFLLVIIGVALAGAAALYFSTRRAAAPGGIPVEVAVQPADTAGFRGYVLGSDSAPVEIIEYADYQCPACNLFESVQFPDVKSRLIDAGRVRWVFRDYPLEMHPHARVAAHAAACANEQGQFWPMHDRIFATQSEWSRRGSATGAFADLARQIGLDAARYEECMSSAKFAGRIEGSRLQAIAAGAGSTPSFVIGGRLYVGVQPFDRIRALVDSLAPATPAPAAAPAATP